MKKTRMKVEGIVLDALTEAIRKGLNMEDSEAIWGGTKEEYIEDLMQGWLDEEDGGIALDRLVSLIIY